MCLFLDIECDEEYLTVCEKAVFSEPSKTRYKVKWAKKQTDTVHKLIQHFSYLQRYSFNSE